MGVKCKKATAKYLGREWIAWYASEIPIPYGPWKLRDLPGLILRAYDSNKEYAFECIGYGYGEMTADIFALNVSKQITKKEFLDTELLMKTDPAKALKSFGVYIDDRAIELINDFKKPKKYNPIERSK